MLCECMKIRNALIDRNEKRLDYYTNVLLVDYEIQYKEWCNIKDKINKLRYDWYYLVGDYEYVRRRKLELLENLLQHSHTNNINEKTNEILQDIDFLRGPEPTLETAPIMPECPNIEILSIIQCHCVDLEMQSIYN